MESGQQHVEMIILRRSAIEGHLDLLTSAWHACIIMYFELFKRCCNMEYRHWVYPLHYISCTIPLSGPALEVSSLFSRYMLSDISCHWRFRCLSDQFYSYHRHWYFPLKRERGRPRTHGSPLIYCTTLYWPILLREGLEVTFYFERESCQSSF